MTAAEHVRGKYTWHATQRRDPRILTRSVSNEIVKDLWPARILDSSDSLLILVAAIHLETAFDAHDMIKRLGTTFPVIRGAYDGQPGYKTLQANPAVNIMRDSLAEFRQCCDLLGIGPSARARLANMGFKGATPVQALPGIGAKPTPLTAVEP